VGKQHPEALQKVCVYCYELHKLQLRIESANTALCKGVSYLNSNPMGEETLIYECNPHVVSDSVHLHAFEEGLDSFTLFRFMVVMHHVKYESKTNIKSGLSLVYSSFGHKYESGTLSKSEDGITFDINKLHVFYLLQRCDTLKDTKVSNSFDLLFKASKNMPMVSY
jgi:hypothetical protein